ncbi:hypothetical protein C8A01DRAFT_32649 [Parachaetomium inaequale]|uniref:Glyoxalase-like domain-containing protein n=1 Tax=Parachaetomium inaequale TaxID=2588326 RepID=A0AAN6SV23_9PEZI|nr:hypothetical protein C8A01DRAFT_32649 [Parachaetomium inaequale]
MVDWRSPKFGAPAWLGISANDVSRVETFYAAVFEWTFRDAPTNDIQPDHPKTHLFNLTPSGVALSGGLQHQPETSRTGTPAAGTGGTFSTGCTCG